MSAWERGDLRWARCSIDVEGTQGMSRDVEGRGRRRRRCWCAVVVGRLCCIVAVSWAHDGDGGGVGSGRAVKEFCRGTLSMMIEGCRGMSGALFCLAQGRRQEGRGNFKSSWREGAGDNAKKFEVGERAHVMMPGNIKWRRCAGNDAEELGAQPLSADCVAARRCC